MIEEKKALIMLDLDLKNLKILSKKDRLVDKYMNNLENINKEPTFREYMSYEENQRKIRNTLMEEGIEKGIEQGIKQGIEEGLKQGSKDTSIMIAKNLLNLNFLIEDISKATNLSIEEIEKLK